MYIHIQAPWVEVEALVMGCSNPGPAGYRVGLLVSCHSLSPDASREVQASTEKTTSPCTQMPNSALKASFLRRSLWLQPRDTSITTPGS